MRKLLTFAALMALAVGVAACTGGDDDDDAATTPTSSPTATPSPSPSPSPAARTVTVNITGATAHNTFLPMARIRSATTTVKCWVGGTAITAGNATLTTTGVMSGGPYTLELVLNLNAGNTVEAADHNYLRTNPFNITTNMTVSFDHANVAGTGWNAEPSGTWTSGACPGTPL